MSAAASAPFVKFFNAPGYIKATDTRTGVTSWFNKRNVVFQAIDDDAPPAGDRDSFLVKSDTYVRYFSWRDVSIPKRANIAALLKQLTAWVVQELKMYEDRPCTVLQVKPYHDDLPGAVNELDNVASAYPAGSGNLAAAASFAPPGAAVASSFDPAARAVLMACPSAPSPGPGGRLVRQSKKYCASPGDKRMVALLTARLGDPALFPAGAAAAAAAGAVSGAAAAAFAAASPAADFAAMAGASARVGVFDDRGDVLAGKGKPLTGNGLFVELAYDPAKGDWATDRLAARDLAELDAAGDLAGKSNYVDRWKSAAL